MHVLDSAAARARTAGPAERLVLLRLAHGMLRRAPSEQHNHARSHHAVIRRTVQRDAGDAGDAAWLLTPSETRATGRVWLLSHEPTVRYRYVIESTARGSDDELYLVEIDAWWNPTIAVARRVESLQAAAAGWEGIKPYLVEHSELLEPLVSATWGRLYLTGFESGPVLAQRFRLTAGSTSSRPRSTSRASTSPPRAATTASRWR